MKHAIPYLIFLFIFLQSSCKEDNTSSIEEIYVETTFQLTIKGRTTRYSFIFISTK